MGEGAADSYRLTWIEVQFVSGYAPGGDREYESSVRIKAKDCSDLIDLRGKCDAAERPPQCGGDIYTEQKAIQIGCVEQSDKAERMICEDPPPPPRRPDDAGATARGNPVLRGVAWRLEAGSVEGAGKWRSSIP
jgi:hypothetical protein